jgi:hypothetical protein
VGLAAENIAHDEEVAQGREIHERLDAVIARMENLLNGFKQAREYPAGHRHLREIPIPDISHYRAWESFLRRQATLANARHLRATWDAERRGNIFT